MFINPLLKTDPQKSTASSCFFLNASAAQLLEEITSVNVCVEPLLKIYVFGKRKKRHNVPLETERLNCHNGRGTIIGLHPSIRFHWIEFSVHSVSDFVMKWKAASYFCISNEDIRSQRWHTCYWQALRNISLNVALCHLQMLHDASLTSDCGEAELWFSRWRMHAHCY